MSTNKQEWNKRHGFDKDKSHTRASIAKVSKIPIKTLDKVYTRGIGAYKTNPQSVRMKGSFKKDVKAPMSKKLSPQQWAGARVISFVNKIEGRKKLNHDRDLLENIPRLKGKNLSTI